MIRKAERKKVIQPIISAQSLTPPRGHTSTIKPRGKEAKGEILISTRCVTAITCGGSKQSVKLKRCFAIRQFSIILWESGCSSSLLKTFLLEDIGDNRV